MIFDRQQLKTQATDDRVRALAHSPLSKHV